MSIFQGAKKRDDGIKADVKEVKKDERTSDSGDVKSKPRKSKQRK